MPLRTCIIPETLVGQFQGQIIPHRLDNLCQEALSGWNLLEENAPLEMMAFIDEVIHGKGVQQPGPHAALLHILSMLDVVKVSGPTVALDVDVEHLLDGILVVMEGFQG